MATSTNEHSGHPLKWFKDQNATRSSFECAVCLDVLKEPVQVRDCGHQFCGLCIDGILRSDPRCPSCRIYISKAMIFQDHAANRLIRKLEVNCSNEGCSWLGNLSTYLEDHVNSCTFLNNNLDVKKLEEQFETRLNLEITALKQERENDLKELKTQRGNDLKELKTQLLSLSLSQHDKDFKELKSQRENDLKELKTQHDKDFKELKSQHEKDLNEIKSKHERDIKELKQEITQVLKSNCSGTFKLEISNFAKRLLRAKSHDRGNEIVGEPFFTSHYGYKVRLEVNLDEKSCGFAGHMGAYVSLLKSDHDGMLSWPFKKLCMLSVIDQQDEESCKEDHVKKFVPEGQDEFKRPQPGENEGRGFQTFISHSKLRTRNYIKNDTVYVVLQVLE